MSSGSSIRLREACDTKRISNWRAMINSRVFPRSQGRVICKNALDWLYQGLIHLHKGVCLRGLGRAPRACLLLRLRA